MTRVYILRIPIFLFGLFSSLLMAQPGSGLPTVSGQLPEVVQESSSLPVKYHPKELIGGRYYRYARFNELPSPSLCHQLKEAGIDLLHPISDVEYLVAIASDTKWSGIPAKTWQSFLSIAPADKYDPLLEEALFPISDSEQLECRIQFQPDLTDDYIRQLLYRPGLELIRYYPSINMARVFISKSELSFISRSPASLYLESPTDELIWESEQTNRIHQANWLKNMVAQQLNFDGTGVHIGVADNGQIGPHIDFQGRIGYNELIEDSGSQHGELVAGILGGAGNLDPRMSGIASGASLHLINTTSPTPPTNSSIDISCNAYGEGCNRGYTTFSQLIDQYIRPGSSSMMVFSAGNAGQKDCGYGSGTGWGTITGGRKLAKNVMTVGNLKTDLSIHSSSSRGPAKDGRIKPDLVAVGSDQYSTAPNHGYAPAQGSSAAAPVVSGIMAQLYQAYQTYYQSEPPSDLIKAILMNTADDLGPKGPDFTFGWGKVNAYQAHRLLVSGHFQAGSITQGEQQYLDLTVPSGTKAIRAMLYWHDAAGVSFGLRTLTNDLDLSARSPSGEKLLPLGPNPLFVQQAATPKTDRLNNAEQITIDQPEAGNYRIVINGHRIPGNPQDYYIVYQFLNDDIQLTYPAGGESFDPGQSTRLHWEAFGAEEEFEILFSSDNGQQWQSIGMSAPETRYFDWKLPEDHNAAVRFRIKRGEKSSTQKIQSFILPPPVGFRIIKRCAETIVMGWDAVPGARSYRIYKLGNQKMQAVQITNDTFLTIHLTRIDHLTERWFSVQAIGNDEVVSRRAVAITDRYHPQDCQIKDDLELIRIQSPAVGNIQNCTANQLEVSFNVRNGGITNSDSFRIFYQLDQEPIVAEGVEAGLPAGVTINRVFSQPINAITTGHHRLKVWLEMTEDEISFNDTARITFQIGDGTLVQAPYFENFDRFDPCHPSDLCGSGCTLSEGWINGSDLKEGDIDWRVHYGSTPTSETGPGNDQNTGTAEGRYLYLESSNSCYSKGSYLSSPCIDLSGVKSPRLSFWYHMRGSDIGHLKVDLFDGQKWHYNLIAPVKGEQGDQWRYASVDLKAFKGKTVSVRFQGETGRGIHSDIAIDNFAVFDMEAPPIPNFTTDGQEVCVDQPIRFFDNSYNTPSQWNWSFSPAEVHFLEGTSAASPNPVVQFAAEGDYQVRLNVRNQYGQSTITSQESYIRVSNGRKIPVQETFNGSSEKFISEWLINNPDEHTTWSTVKVPGIDGSITTAVYVNNHSYDAIGQEDEMVSFAIDLTGATRPILRFDVSYAQYDPVFADQLQVRIQNRCSENESETVYNKKGIDLATAEVQTYDYLPQLPVDWRTEIVDLSAYAGSVVSLSFTNVNGFGNNLFVDNITVSEMLSVPSASFTAERLCQDESTLFANTTSGGTDNRYQWDFGPGAIPSTATGFGPHQVYFVGTGPTRVRLTASNEWGRSTSEQTFEVQRSPSAHFTARPDNYQVAFQNQSKHATTYHWDFGDGYSSSQQHPLHLYARPGTYRVSLRAENDCGMVSYQETIRVSGELFQPSAYRLFPNPASDQLYLINGQPFGQIQSLSVFDMTGRVLSSIDRLEADQQGRYSLDVGALSPGTYWLRWQEGADWHSHKFIVLHP